MTQATFEINRSSAKGGKAFCLGAVMNQRKAPRFFRVVAAERETIAGYDADGLAMGLGADEATIYTATCEPITKKEYREHLGSAGYSAAQIAKSMQW